MGLVGVDAAYCIVTNESYTELETWRAKRTLGIQIPSRERVAVRHTTVVWLCAVAPDVCTLTGRDRLESLYS